MGKIFTSAQRVICWLGESDHGSRLSFQLLYDLNSCLPYRDICARTILKLDYRLHWHGFYSLFYREFWWRVWVIQEITLAKSIIVLCGSDSFSWSDLVKIQETLAMHHLSDIDTIAHGNPALTFLCVSIESRGPRALLMSSENSETPDLNQTLLKHRFKQSTDPKDKIYSLLGLSMAANDPSFIIDYTRSVRQVFTDVIEYVVRTSRKLDIICAISRSQTPHNLSSWAPNWAFDEMGSSLLDEKPKHQYFASADLPADAIFDLKRGILRAKGVQTGTIELILSPTEMKDLDDDCNALRSLHTWFGEVAPFKLEDGLKTDKSETEEMKEEDEENENEKEIYAESFCAPSSATESNPPTSVWTSHRLCCYALRYEHSYGLPIASRQILRYHNISGDLGITGRRSRD